MLCHAVGREQHLDGRLRIALWMSLRNNIFASDSRFAIEFEERLVPGGGVEPPRPQGPADFESAASASSAIPACATEGWNHFTSEMSAGLVRTLLWPGPNPRSRFRSDDPMKSAALSELRNESATAIHSVLR